MPAVWPSAQTCDPHQAHTFDWLAPYDHAVSKGDDSHRVWLGSRGCIARVSLEKSMHRIDVHKLADEAKFNRFHAVVLLWCVLIIIIDGYDIAVAGVALPSIMKDMGVNASTAGFMAGSALFGMMFGAIFLGALADKIGRRWTISICVGCSASSPRRPDSPAILSRSASCASSPASASAV